MSLYRTRSTILEVTNSVDQSFFFESVIVPQLRKNSWKLKDPKFHYCVVNTSCGPLPDTNIRCNLHCQTHTKHILSSVTRCGSVLSPTLSKVSALTLKILQIPSKNGIQRDALVVR